ncbi:bifunctional alpha/beta hydrolase/OsmC family protein [Emcibacter sp. SYSU 3D8]|uniref:bifunctional alpha/beta hydrolase/OsmC family protein n=1 Tax=Emcibacter sp. SYSU 3D8 TaxID=3133969 RepID=UPI0031FF395F
MPVPSGKITFKGTQGQDLAARLDMPDGEVRAYALFAHCFTCNKDALAASRIARGLSERGIAVLRFDFTGLGSSDGDFANTSFSSNVEDLLAAAEFLRREHRAPAILVGHSLGGAAMLRAAVDIPEANVVATIGAPADPAHVARLIKDPEDEIRRKGKAVVDVGGRPFEIGAGFLDDLRTHQPSDYLGRLHKALIVFHAPLDQTVGIENAGDIFLAARHPKSFVSLDGANHLLSNVADAAYVADILAAWASRYMEGAEADAGEFPPDGLVRVSDTGPGRLEQDVRVGRHHLVADEPTTIPGGADRGPTPYDLLGASLGTCTSMTLRLYADRKKFDLRHIVVDVVHDRIHATDCTDCETREVKIDVLRRTIRLEGDLSDEEREKLIAIADKCPVHRTLTNEIRIETVEA